MWTLFVDRAQFAGVLVIIATLVFVVGFLVGFVRRVRYLKTLGSAGESRISGELFSCPVAGMLGILGLSFGRMLLGP